MYLIEFQTLAGKVPLSLIDYLSYKVQKKNYPNKECYVGAVNELQEGLITLSDIDFIKAVNSAVIFNNDNPPIELSDNEKEEFAQSFIEKYSRDQTKEAIQDQNSRDCKEYILSKYSITIQNSMNAGVYSTAATDAFKGFLAGCIAEENRVYDLLEVSDDPVNVEEPVWPEV